MNKFKFLQITHKFTFLAILILSINSLFAGVDSKFTFHSASDAKNALDAVFCLIHPDSVLEKRGKVNQTQDKEEAYQIKTIVIDAGHGGHDPGCSGASSKEKDIVLSISKRLAKLFEKNYPEIKIILTRDKDVFIPLYKRADLANENDADLFISLHCNAAPKKAQSAHGTETYVMGLHTSKYNLDVAKRENDAILYEEDYHQNYAYDPNSAEGHIMLSMFQNAFLDQSILFAKKVEQQFKYVAHRKSRGVKQAGFVVLKRTTMPSVLIETGFLSNRTEEKFLFTAAGQNAIANSIISAFAQYKEIMEGQQSAYPKLAKVDAPPVNKPAPVQNKVVKQKSTPFNQTQNQTQKKSAYSISKWETPDNYSLRNSNKNKATNFKKGNEKGTNSGYSQQAISRADISFKVQIASSSSEIRIVGDNRWENIGYLVEMIEENNLYKYLVGDFKSLDQAERVRTKLQVKGFSDSFLVAYQGGKRIPLREAVKLFDQ